LTTMLLRLRSFMTHRTTNDWQSKNHCYKSHSSR
jgi:hypothetical protein